MKQLASFLVGEAGQPTGWPDKDVIPPKAGIQNPASPLAGEAGLAKGQAG